MSFMVFYGLLWSFAISAPQILPAEAEWRSFSQYLLLRPSERRLHDVPQLDSYETLQIGVSSLAGGEPTQPTSESIPAPSAKPRARSQKLHLSGDGDGEKEAPQ